MSSSRLFRLNDMETYYLVRNTWKVQDGRRFTYNSFVMNDHKVRIIDVLAPYFRYTPRTSQIFNGYSGEDVEYDVW
nr:hypothetical protein [Tanacetum cinerariifolium]